MRPFVHTSVTYFVVTVFYIIMVFVEGISWTPIIILSIIYVTLLVLGAIYIQWNFYVKSFHQGKEKKWISLTFDDGPAKETNAILDILKEQNVSATFFSIGKNAEANPEIVNRWDDEDHLIGNHSYHHSFNFDWQSAKKMLAEIETTNSLIQQLTGKTPKLFRPPYGVTNPNLAKAIRKSGMHSIGWNIRSFDTTAKDNQKLLARILQKVEGGDIILLHDSMNITKEILTELIESLRNKGYSFVRLDKLLDIEPYE